MAKKLKRGAASGREMEQIAANRDMPLAELAALLNRSENFVRKQIAALPTVEKQIEQGDWVARLHSSSFWPEVRKGLIGSEVGYFEQAWASYNEQFGSATDILATDELMIKDLVLLDICGQRAFTERATVLRRIAELERMIDDEQEKDIDSRDMQELALWKTQLSAALTSKNALSKEHQDYQQRKDAKLRDLKGSRDQRFKQIEESRRNIFELIKELDKHKRREQEGRLADKVRIAAANVADDWNELTEYEDGTVDKPFLSPEGELKDE